MPEKIVLAYSGGLDTSVAAHWLRDQRGYEVHCLTIDLGNLGDTAGIHERGQQAGAADVESDLVVALTGAAVRDSGRADLARLVHEQLRDEGTAQRGGEGVAALVHHAGLEGGEDEVAE
ncbi:MAG: hypothetical protein DWG80_06805, partial [Chloroflexi bacterium]|nr:hypothetical protein [Chloroflexota bacterium]